MVLEAWTIRGAGIVAATYLVVAVFYLRLALHALLWWEAAWRSPPSRSQSVGATARAVAGATVDIVLLRRLFIVNPALWIGEWFFHASLFVVVLRHLRYFMNPVPAWVVWAQTPGWIAGLLLPAAVLFILAIRLLTGQEQFSSRANLLMLLDVLAIGATGLLMSTRFRVDLTAVKLFALGIVTFNPSAPPPDILFTLHLGFVLALLLFVPSHVFTAPLTMLDAQRRELELRRLMHDA
jgi:nitrate reductase gamma subunit